MPNSGDLPILSAIAIHCVCNFQEHLDESRDVSLEQYGDVLWLQSFGYSGLVVRGWPFLHILFGYRFGHILPFFVQPVVFGDAAAAKHERLRDNQAHGVVGARFLDLFPDIRSDVLVFVLSYLVLCISCTKGSDHQDAYNLWESHKAVCAYGNEYKVSSWLISYHKQQKVSNVGQSLERRGYRESSVWSDKEQCVNAHIVAHRTRGTRILDRLFRHLGVCR